MKLSTELYKYNNIGIDLDETLINTDKAFFIAKYIINNPDKNYYIVTFRSHGLEEKNRVFNSLMTYLRVDMRKYFINIISIPYEDYENKHIANVQKGVISKEKYDSLLYNYLHFKGKRCKELGIEVLIDDDIKGVILGCTKYNIPLINTNEISSL